MQLFATLAHMYPNLKIDEDYILREDPDTGENVILEWNADVEQPTTQSISEHWEQFKDEIEKLFERQPSELEILEQTQADLIMALMMNGVI
jgi:hypothetical protein